MKKLLTLLAILMLLMSGCSSSDAGQDPQSLLELAYQKQKDAKNLTIGGTIDLAMSDDNDTSLDIPIVLTSILDTSDISNPASYTSTVMNIFNEDIAIETWTKDGMIYTSDGEYKTYTATEVLPTTDISPADFAARMIALADKVKVTTDNGNFVIVLTPKDNAMSELLSLFNDTEKIADLSGGLLDESDLSSMKVSDILLTIADGYISNVSFGASGESEGLMIDTVVDLDLYDYNTSRIPDFDPSEFVEEGNAEVEDYYADVVFDDGIEIIVFMSDNENYGVYFDDDSQMLSIYDSQNYLVDGIFVADEFAQTMIQEINADGEAYTISSEEAMADPEGTILIGKTLKDTEYFNANTPIAVVTFSGYDLGLVYVGYYDEDSFRSIMNQIEYTIFYTE